jgi:hypothetical protein
MAFLTFREVGFQNYQIIAAANKRYGVKRIERAPTRSALRRCEPEAFACPQEQMMRTSKALRNHDGALANAVRALSKAFDREDLKLGNQTSARG